MSGIDEQIIIVTRSGLAVLCWVVVAIGWGAAIFSPRINDSWLERLALAWVSIGACAAAWRALSFGWITNTGWLISMGLALHVVAVYLKHLRQKRREHELELTREKKA